MCLNQKYKIGEIITYPAQMIRCLRCGATLSAPERQAVYSGHKNVDTGWIDDVRPPYDLFILINGIMHCTHCGAPLVLCAYPCDGGDGVTATVETDLDAWIDGVERLITREKVTVKNETNNRG